MIRTGGHSTTRGFTIVELLIVIVVIGILAAITLVAYGNISQRAKLSSVNTALAQLNKSIEAYRSTNGSYPDTSNTWVSQYESNKDTFIPGLAPSVVNSLPLPPSIQGNPHMYYRSNATDYKLLYLYPSTESIANDIASDSSVSTKLDPIRPTRGWGYWTSGAAGY